MQYRSEIDGLRAIAVISVILYHSRFSLLGGGPLLPGGFIGVDLFFVISGYLIFFIIYKELLITGTFSFKKFLQRRIRRIIPALLLVKIATLIFAYIYLLPDDLIDYSKSILYSLGFVSNFYFWHSGQDYGAQSALLIPFLHTWSLSVEWQFYIIFPLIVVVVFIKFKRYLLKILILFFLISLFFADYSSRNYQTLSFYILPTRMWELISGSILAYLQMQFGHQRTDTKLKSILPSIGLFLIIYSLFFYDEKILHPSFYTLSPILGVCLIIYFSNKNELITKIISTKLFTSIGLISYSLYLWHYPILAFARYTDFIQANVFRKVFLGIIILLISVFSYYFIEKISRNKKYAFKSIIFFIFLFSLIIILLNTMIIFKKGYKSRMPKILESFYDYKNINYLKNEDNEICYESFSNKVNCTFNKQSNKKIFMIGDSLIGNLALDFKDKIVRKNYNFTPFILGSCPYFVGFDRVNKKTEKVHQNCNNEYFLKINNILNDNPNSIIIFGGRFPLYLNDYYMYSKTKWDEKFVPSKQSYFKKIEDSFNKSLIELSMNNKIILIYPFPEIGLNVPKEIFHSKKEITISEKEYKKYTQTTFELLDSVKNPNIHRVYFHKILCNNSTKDRCITHNDNHIFYADDIHLTIKGAEIVNDLIIKEIEKIEQKDTN